MEAQKFTARAMAELIGTSEPAVVKYARGERIPRPEIMHRIEAATAGRVQAADFYEHANHRANSVGAA